ncbi:MAG TPA: hypothetical protein VFW07_12455 [Parafilimonas sp.]|nr:hypothetical protein [Parafilimonas sp.]
MKKILVLIISMLIARASFSQTDTAQALTKGYYMRKAKNQKITAFVLIGAGVTMFVAGGAINFNDNFLEGNSDKGLWLCYVGGAVTLSSIPFFIASHKNKVKGLSLALKKQPVYLPYNNTAFMQPAISLQIGMGK